MKNHIIPEGKLPLVAACDIESTLTPVEGWDFLAQMATREIQELVGQITVSGMNGGEMSFKEALFKRWDLLQYLLGPEHDGLRLLQEEYLRYVNEEVIKIVGFLRRKFKRVICISGGLHDAVLPFAARLEMTNDLFAIPLTPKGTLPNKHPLYASDGKKRVLHRVIAEEIIKHNLNGNACHNIMIGDGITDAATRGKDVTFIAVGNREKVIRAADIHFPSFSEIPTYIF